MHQLKKYSGQLATNTGYIGFPANP